MNTAYYFKQIADKANRQQAEKIHNIAQEIIKNNEEQIEELATRGIYRTQFNITPANVREAVMKIYREDGYGVSCDGCCITVSWEE